MHAITTPLRSARKAAGLTLADVACEVGSDTGNLSRIETARQVPSARLVDRLLALFSSHGLTDEHLYFPLRFVDEVKGTGCDSVTATPKNMEVLP